MPPLTCPICSRPLEPVLSDRTVYALSADDTNALVAGLKAFTCGPKGHIVIVADGKHDQLPYANGRGRQADTPGQRAVLNSWKEIAAYMGRGVRTVQRWEATLGLPVHRPKGKDRSAVLALAEELDTWLRRTPVRFLAQSSAPEAPPTGTAQSA